MGKTIHPVSYNKVFLITVITCILSACVSVNLGNKKPKKSDEAHYSAPARPFAELSTSSADRAWLNKDNGNSIAYHSSCNDPADPSLEAAQQEVLSAFEDSKITKTFTRDFDGREALNTEAEGSVDGVKTRTEFLIFKKNNCIYTLSYVGVAKRYAENQPQFQQFVNTFGVP